MTPVFMSLMWLHAEWRLSSCHWCDYMLNDACLHVTDVITCWMTPLSRHCTTASRRMTTITSLLQMQAGWRSLVTVVAIKHTIGHKYRHLHKMPVVLNICFRNGDAVMKWRLCRGIVDFLEDGLRSCDMCGFIVCFITVYGESSCFYSLPSQTEVYCFQVCSCTQSSWFLRYSRINTPLPFVSDDLREHKLHCRIRKQQADEMNCRNPRFAYPGHAVSNFHLHFFLSPQQLRR